ncbi:MAG TPA: thiamine pyrophosphate-requiring protein [Bryobacteraceae bacterium]|nr:thiamine pyrophosphate-requiring protein [Bryobacteraceae bacterium]
MPTAATAFLSALHESGVSYIFANLGTDHPPILESLAEAHATGQPVPQLITCPHEMVALSAAHGYAQATGRAQVVLVHVDCGTQSLGGAVHNAAKGRVPVLLFAGMSPFTQEGELRGSRNEWVHWVQDVLDQRGIVRGYVKYENEIRTGRNIKQIVHRAMQLAHSDPKGPVYLTASREVLEEEVPAVSASDPNLWHPLAPGAIDPSAAALIAQDLMAARRPLVISSYLGRNPAAVAELVKLCHALGIGVWTSIPTYLDFPADDPLYLGNQVNAPVRNAALEEADVVLVLDSDVPWIPMVSKPNPAARIYHIDVDPLKQQMPLWYFPMQHSFRADAATALAQINAYVASAKANGKVDETLVGQRRAHYSAIHEARMKELAAREIPREDAITPEHLTASVREHLPPDALVLDEGITSHNTIADHIRATRPGSFFTAAGGSIGWSTGAAVGIKLANPDKTVVALTGDGCFMESIPSSAHWMARRYQTPFVQVVYNNRGWKAPKMSALAIHPHGYASKSKDMGVAFDPPPDYSGIAAAAGGAFAAIVRQPCELDRALSEAFRVVRDEGRCAVLDVWLPGF